MFYDTILFTGGIHPLFGGKILQNFCFGTEYVTFDKDILDVMMPCVCIVRLELQFVG
jgi:hypothetical protein